MTYEPPCGGGGDCAHLYQGDGSETIRCVYCGHRSSRADHSWRQGPFGSALCTECYATLAAA